MGHHPADRQGIDRGRLTIHADRGPAMTSKPVALLLADLGHGRPVTSFAKHKHVAEEIESSRGFRPY